MRPDGGDTDLGHFLAGGAATVDDTPARVPKDGIDTIGSDVGCGFCREFLN